VDLDGPLARDVERRLLERAERVGGELPRQYLSERLDRLKDEWRRKRDENSSALGYRKEKHKTTVVNGLLRRADGSRWTELTVGMSMRETENEINLLLPGGGAFLEDPSGGGPDWNFGAVDTETDRDLAATVDSDEYGPTTADTPRRAQR
jgi:hypothetical protein